MSEFVIGHSKMGEIYAAGEGGTVRCCLGQGWLSMLVAGAGRKADGETNPFCLIMSWEQFDAWVKVLNEARKQL